ncbi:MAG: 50S ribosomal protein L6 [Fibrobacterales bacterium]
MSRVGRAPIVIPDKVKATVSGQDIAVEGPKGKLSYTVHENIAIEQNENEVVLTRTGDAPFERSIHGTSRANVQNMVTGVTEGFSKTLNIVGVGYRVEQKGKNLNILLGFSHPVPVAAPEGITLKAEGTNKIVVSGIDKQQVGQIASEIRNWRRPEPYKGKGIHYEGEQILRKQGKKAGK